MKTAICAIAAVRTWRWAAVAACGLALLAAAGCEDDEDYRDHVPAAGQGSLIVDNNTMQDLDLFLDGALNREVGDGKEAIVDLAPGEYRVVLDSQDSNRSFAGDVDVLEGRLTILHVSIRLGAPDALNVTIEYED